MVDNNTVGEADAYTFKDTERMAPGAKSNAAAKKNAKKGRSAEKTGTYTTYIKRLAKKGGKKVALSGKAVKVLQSFVADLFEQLAMEAGSLARSTKKKTISSSEIQTAVRLTLPPELAAHAIAESSKAVTAASK